MHSTIFTTALIFIGGGLGSLARYGVAIGLRAAGATPDGFPTGTLVVNILGCFAIGLVAQAVVSGWGVREDLRLALTVGLLGGFTTFSSFGLESVQMWSDGHHARALAYVLLSNGLGMAAAVAGIGLMHGRTPA
jgi:CrcB protein